MIDLDRHTIFLTLAGSHAHGTANARSDVDLRGVCVAPLDLRVSIRTAFEQYEGAPTGRLRTSAREALRSRAIELPEKVECVAFDVAKFVKLCAAANPNALEILFADRGDWIHATALWTKLYDARALFLTMKVRETYLGYALAQLKRIRTHRQWLLEPPARKPTRADFGLPEHSTLSADDRNRIEQAVAEKIRSWGIDDLEMPKGTRIALRERLEAFQRDVLGERGVHEAAEASLGIPAEVASALGRERRYLAALKHWQSYERHQAERNPARAKLEAEFGYDTKHAMHLVRLMRTGLDVLRTGSLAVRRADAAELVAIRNGALDYEALMAEAERLDREMEASLASCALPADVDYDAVDALLVEIVREAEAQERSAAE
jgi:predicted nucleotidyltransferase